VAAAEVERIRDFIILHIPPDDAHRWRPVAVLRPHADPRTRCGTRSTISSTSAGSSPATWTSSATPAGCRAHRADELARAQRPIARLPRFERTEYLERLRVAMDQAAQGLPTHRAYVERPLPGGADMRRRAACCWLCWRRPARPPPWPPRRRLQCGRAHLQPRRVAIAVKAAPLRQQRAASLLGRIVRVRTTRTMPTGCRAWPSPARCRACWS
jgi:hypothetical protein